MAPEQARGEVEAIDERADVFALGSILCEVLTGTPAFVGRTSAEIQRKAARGETADALARLEGCGAEAELVAPGPRLPGRRAGGPAAGRPRRRRPGRRRTWPACRSGCAPPSSTRAVAEARAVEERRRRRLQVGLAASLLALTTIGGLAFTYVMHQRQARAARVDRLLAEATLLRDQARAQPEVVAHWERAREAVGRIADELGPAAAAPVESLRRTVAAGLEAAVADRELLARLVDIRSAVADDPDGSATDAAYADAFARRPGSTPTHWRPAEAGGRIARRPEAGGRGPGGRAGPLGGRPPRAGRRRGRAGDGCWPSPAPPTPTRTATPSARPCSSRTRSRAARTAAAAGRPGRRRESGPGEPGRCWAGPWPTRATRTRAWRCCGGPAGRTPSDARVHFAARRVAAAGRGRRSRRRRSAPLARPGPAAGAGRARPGPCPGASRPRRGGRGGLARPGRPPARRRPPPGLLWPPPEGAGPRRGGRPGAPPGDRGVPRGDPAEARRRPGPRQPRRRPAGLGRPARGDRGVPRGDPAEARRRPGPRQPRRRPAGIGRPARGDRGVPRGDPAASPTSPRPTPASAPPWRASGDLPGAIAACREAIRLRPDDAEAHSNLGVALAGSGDLPGAIAAYREAIQLRARLSPKPTPTSASPCGNRATCRGDRGVPRGDPAEARPRRGPRQPRRRPARLG